jgi:hypothetical protein
MLVSRTFTGVLLALSIALVPAGAVLAQTAHDGHGASAAPLELVLDNGGKWQTDDPLRTGMTVIRAVLEGALPAVHDGKFAAQDYAELAQSLEKEVDGIVTNCKLPEAADAQLHIILAQLLDGIGTMKDADGQEYGVVKAVEAANAYGAYFDHPGWQALAL